MITSEELSKKFNEHGWRTLALSGADSEEVRRDAIERLVNDDINELDYILSVDIFSEGVDVPEINQVIMLRPTQSPIVFIQQLGRGLRKAEGTQLKADEPGDQVRNLESRCPLNLQGHLTKDETWCSKDETWCSKMRDDVLK